MTKLSVVTATLNALPALQRTSASLTEQTCDDFEHIIVDGGSTDGTVEWLRTQPTARWISEADDGIADALNKGFRLAQGEFVLVLQAGDTLLAEHSIGEALEHAAALQPADIVAFDIMFGDTRRCGHSFPSLRLEWKPLHHQGLLFRRTLFERLGAFDTSYRICMDYDLLLRAEERRVHLAYCGGIGRAIHAAYWPLYIWYRSLKRS
jgi:putative colanic acid biosynthesis glycosyltransferase